MATPSRSGNGQSTRQRARCFEQCVAPSDELRCRVGVAERLPPIGVFCLPRGSHRVDECYGLSFSQSSSALQFFARSVTFVVKPLKVGIYLEVYGFFSYVVHFVICSIANTVTRGTLEAEKRGIHINICFVVNCCSVFFIILTIFIIIYYNII